MNIRGRWARTGAVAMTTVLAFGAAACGSDDSAGDSGAAPSGTSGDSSGASSDSVAGEEEGAEQVEILLAHYEAPGAGDTIEALATKYEELNPNVDIELQYTAFPEYQSTIKLQASSNSAPDIIEAGQGHTMQAPLVEAGLLMPLDSYSDQYGWDAIVPGVLASQNSVADGGKTFGTGSLYAMPLGGNMVGLFYNEALVAEYGIEAPFETLADFEDALETVAAAGVTPIQMGDLGGGPASHTSGAFIARYADPDTVRNWIFGQPGANIDTPETQQALATFQNWQDSGYINDDALGTAYQDAVTRFQEGESPFMIGGSWLQPGIDETIGQDARFQLLPPVEAGDPPRAPGALNGVFGISSKTEKADVAADIINFMANGGNAELLAAGGFLPLEPLDLEPTGASLDTLLAAWYDMNENDGMGLFLDWATPSMGSDAYFTGLQELLADRTSPEEVLSDMQSNWEAFNGS